MTECRSGCGACCDPVVLSLSQTEFSQMVGIPADIRRWILHDLTPMPRREAKLKAPWNFARSVTALRVIDSMPWYFSCRHFDAETRRCGIFEDRPKPCRDYPWGGEKPTPSTVLPPSCSFRADIAKEVFPVPVNFVTKPK